MFLFYFSRGNSLTPYSKSVPAVIAKASAIYNPIIYAIIHPRYRYSKYIGMCITVHANVDLLHRTSYPHSFSLTPCSSCSWADQAMMGSEWSDPDMALGVAKGEQSLPSPFLSLRALLCPVELHNTVTDRKEKMMLRSPFSIAETATAEHSLDKRSQPARLKKSHPYQFKQLCIHMFEVWFSEAIFFTKKFETLTAKNTLLYKGDILVIEMLSSIPVGLFASLSKCSYHKVMLCQKFWENTGISWW